MIKKKKWAHYYQTYRNKKDYKRLLLKIKRKQINLDKI